MRGSVSSPRQYPPPHRYRGAVRGGDPRGDDEVLIANAYFLPGYRLLHELRRAAGRGVRVH